MGPCLEGHEQACLQAWAGEACFLVVVVVPHSVEALEVLRRTLLSEEHILDAA